MKVARKTVGPKVPTVFTPMVVEYNAAMTRGVFTSKYYKGTKRRAQNAGMDADEVVKHAKDAYNRACEVWDAHH